MTLKTRCYSDLETLAGSPLNTFTPGCVYTRDLSERFGGIIEMAILSMTDIRIQIKDDLTPSTGTTLQEFNPDDELLAQQADIVQYRIDHRKKEAQPIFQWVASPCKPADEKRHTRLLTIAARDAGNDSVKRLAA